MDAYIRVSRVGGRDGEAYHSPEIQRAEIERWAQFAGVEVGKIVKEEDVSGGRAVIDRGLEQLIKRAEEGVSQGVVVHRLDRFGRDHVETVKAVKRLRDAGTRLVGVADGVDSDQPHSKMLINFLATEAETYLDRVRDNWASVTSRAVDRGVHVSSRAPTGYLRVDQADPQHDAKGNLIRDGRLVPDGDAAKAVRRAYELRSQGVSHGKVFAFLRDALGRPIAKSTATGILRNRVYLGEARGPGGVVNRDAHEPLVSPELFDRVQARNGTYVARDGSVSQQARLGGLITCASCGHKLRVMGTTIKGERVASYVCVAKYASGDCAEPAAALVRLVDDYTAERLRDSWEEVTELGQSAEQRYINAREAVKGAEEALDAWVDDPVVSITLGAERFQRGLLARQKALTDAKRALYDLDEVDVGDDAPVVWIDGNPHLYEQWGLDPEADRRHLRRHVAFVTLAKADPKRRRWQPIAERVAIRWIGE